jgi:hypothetical protein
MHQENERYYELAERWLNGTITKKEMQEFSEWYTNDENNPLTIPDHFARSEEELRQRILSQVRKNKKRSKTAFLNSNFMKVAAVVLLITLSVLSLVYISVPAENNSYDNKLIGTTLITDSVVPGGNNVILPAGFIYINVSPIINGTPNSQRLKNDDPGDLTLLNQIPRKWENKNYFYPIPEPTRTANPKLSQNPGW